LPFLKSTGSPLPEETTIGVDIRYATALFDLRPGALGEFKLNVTFPKAPESADLVELLAEVRHLLKPMSVLNEPDIVSRVEAEMTAKQ
jgi:hypothetical protein